MHRAWSGENIFDYFAKCKITVENFHHHFPVEENMVDIGKCFWRSWARKWDYLLIEMHSCRVCGNTSQHIMNSNYHNSPRRDWLQWRCQCPFHSTERNMGVANAGHGAEAWSETDQRTLGKQLGDEINLSGFNLMFADRQPTARRWAKLKTFRVNFE